VNHSVRTFPDGGQGDVHTKLLCGHCSTITAGVGSACRFSTGLSPIPSSCLPSLTVTAMNDATTLKAALTTATQELSVVVVQAESVAVVQAGLERSNVRTSCTT
jgi:hypothetical protein